MSIIDTTFPERKDQILTPALLIDLEAMEANLARMAAFYRERPAKLRPHFKTHKSPAIARLQIEAGAIGMTCAKLSEAEALVEAGIESVLIANQVVEPVKIRRLAELAKTCQVIVAVDSLENAQTISQIAVEAQSEIGTLVEVNVGLNRCGVEPGEPALALAQALNALPGVRFLGVLGYEGHAVLQPEAQERARRVEAAMGALVRSAELIRQAGLPVEIVSAGGTGTYDLTGDFPGITEVEAGSYPFMDAKYQKLGLPFRQAVTLLTSVISLPASGRAVLDAGMKAITTDNGLPGVHSPAGVELVALHEEHGLLKFDPQSAHLKLGSRVELVPSHICTTVNLHDRYYGLRGEQVEVIWPISGRGKFV